MNRFLLDGLIWYVILMFLLLVPREIHLWLEDRKLNNFLRKKKRTEEKGRKIKRIFKKG
jgi:hypothetical protein